MDLRQKQGKAPVKTTLYKYYRVYAGERLSTFINPEHGLLVRAPHRCIRILIAKGQEIISNRENGPRLTQDERRRKTVARGLHCYASKKQAMENCTYQGIVVQMKGEHKDFVAHGKYGTHKVYHKLTPVKIVAVGRSLDSEINDTNIPAA